MEVYVSNRNAAYVGAARVRSRVSAGLSPISAGKDAARHVDRLRFAEDRGGTDRDGALATAHARLRDIDLAPRRIAADADAVRVRKPSCRAAALLGSPAISAAMPTSVRDSATMRLSG